MDKFLSKASIAWLATAIAISLAIYVTKDTKCLWFFLLPLMIS